MQQEQQEKPLEEADPWDVDEEAAEWLQGQQHTLQHVSHNEGTKPKQQTQREESSVDVKAGAQNAPKDSEKPQTCSHDSMTRKRKEVTQEEHEEEGNDSQGTKSTNDQIITRLKEEMPT